MSAFALQVVVEPLDGNPDVIGTATLLAANLAITARHVLEDIITRFGAVHIDGHRNEIHDYHVRLYGVYPGPEYVIYDIATAWLCNETDIAILNLNVWGLSGPIPTIDRGLSVNVEPPSVGSSVVAFGYHSSTIQRTANDDGDYDLDLNGTPTASTGYVQEVLHTGQPAGRFSFPCLMVNMRFDGGMSGGPVFDGTGAVCGIVSGSLAFGSPDDEPLGYVALLWPMLRQLISVNRGDSYPQDVTYPMIDLALDGQMSARGLEWLDAAKFPGRVLPRRPD